IQLLQDDKNNQIGYLGCSRDITLRKKNQFEKEELEAKLRQAQKMEAIGTLAGGIAHDFNNILQSILWNIEILKMDLPHPNPLHENIEQALKAGFRAKDLVNQILTISRQSDHEYIPIKPHIILKDSLKLLRASLPVTIEIIDDIDNKCGLILGDPTSLHQIIINLCTNAQYAMRETGGKIKISLKQMEITDQDSNIKGMTPHPGKYIRLEVSDTGCGMDKQILPKIFDPYFTTKKLGEGTGLGLSVVHGITKKLGGEIIVFSDLSVGTAFHVYFPLYSNYDIFENKIYNEPVPNGDERVLVVDDEEAIVRAEQRILESLGYHVTPFIDSREALKVISANPDKFDIILTDMTMPHMDGAELARRIFLIRPNLPVIICTGFSEIMDKAKALSMGIKAYINKPILKRDIANIIRKVLNENQSAC
ncbi:MAG: response regulator, partial [Desulfobacteraceae bacterium]